MADIELVEDYDLTAGLKVKNLDVPKMKISIIIKSPPAGLEKALAKEKVAGQKVIEAAIEKLKKLKEDVQGGIEDVDKGYEKSPPADKREAEDRAKTLTKVCNDIVDAQAGAIAKVALKEWEKQAEKYNSLTAFKVVFGFKMALGTISVAASIVAAAMSMGTLAVTILGAAKTVASMAVTIKDFIRDIEKTEQEIISTDKDLAGRWDDKKLTAGKVGKELASALGVPFTKGANTLEGLLKEYNAKNGTKDKASETMWSKAQELMKAIEKTPDKVDPKTEEALKKLSGEVTDLLNKINTLQAESKSNDTFYEVYSARLKTYEDMQGKALGRTAAGTQISVVIAGIASTANTIVGIASKL